MIDFVNELTRVRSYTGPDFWSRLTVKLYPHEVASFWVPHRPGAYLGPLSPGKKGAILGFEFEVIPYPTFFIDPGMA